VQGPRPSGLCLVGAEKKMERISDTPVAIQTGRSDVCAAAGRSGAQARGGATVMATSDMAKVEALEEVLEKMQEIAECLRTLDDQEIRYRVLPQFEGQEGGWLGEFARDILQARLDAYLHDDEEDADAADEFDRNCL